MITVSTNVVKVNRYESYSDFFLWDWGSMMDIYIPLFMSFTILCFMWICLDTTLKKKICLDTDKARFRLASVDIFLLLLLRVGRRIEMASVCIVSFTAHGLLARAAWVDGISAWGQLKTYHPHTWSLYRKYILQRHDRRLHHSLNHWAVPSIPFRSIVEPSIVPKFPTDTRSRVDGARLYIQL